jgi:cbb3-type cytochrome oxidase maturation protein
LEVIYLLIPGMIFLGLVMVWALVWAVKNGQYDDLKGDGQRILMDEDDPLLPKKRPGKTTDNNKKQAGINWPDADDS